MTAYEYGFAEKCAEFGVDPACLLKAAGFLASVDQFMDNHPMLTTAITGRTRAESRAVAARTRTMAAARRMMGRDRRPMPAPVQAVAPAMGKSANAFGGYSHAIMTNPRAALLFTGKTPEALRREQAIARPQHNPMPARTSATRPQVAQPGGMATTVR